jgi:hypothetical protein
VKVVVPSSQKSWIGESKQSCSGSRADASLAGNAFHIKEITKGKYYYPKEPSE